MTEHVWLRNRQKRYELAYCIRPAWVLKALALLPLTEEMLELVRQTLITECQNKVAEFSRSNQDGYFRDSRVIELNRALAILSGEKGTP